MKARLSSKEMNRTVHTLPFSGTFHFSDLFFGWLLETAHEVDESHAGAVHVTGPDVDTWFTHHTASGSDLPTAHRVLRRHSLVRSLLARKGVRRIGGRLVSSQQGVHQIAPLRRDASSPFRFRSHGSYLVLAPSTLTRRRRSSAASRPTGGLSNSTPTYKESLSWRLEREHWPR